MNNAVTILRKVLSKNEKSFSSVVSVRKPYGLSAEFLKDPKKFNMPEISEAPINDGITIYGTLNYKTVKRFASKNYPISNGIDSVYKYKVFVSQVLDNGFDFRKERLKPFLGEPSEICTETFLIIGPFDSKEAAERVIAYINTKFFHLLMFLKKISHHVTTKVYQYVPLQDFSDKSEIDWSKSIIDIDRQLFSKYDLSRDEKSFIETNIKSIE
jgi:hypothetical protein